MYYDYHNPPHFHALYEGLEAAFDFNGNLILGNMPLKAHQLIKEWCNLHYNELEENWRRARDEKQLNWIEPLR